MFDPDDFALAPTTRSENALTGKTTMTVRQAILSQITSEWETATHVSRRTRYNFGTIGGDMKTLFEAGRLERRVQPSHLKDKSTSVPPFEYRLKGEGV